MSLDIGLILCVDTGHSVDTSNVLRRNWKLRCET